MNKNCIIVHGSFSNPFQNWFSWLHDELEKDNYNVYVPQFPVGVPKLHQLV